MSDATATLHWSLAGIEWPDGAVTRKTLRAMMTAAHPGMQLSPWMRDTIKRIDQRGGLIRRGSYMVGITDRDTLLSSAASLEPYQMLIAVAEITDYVNSGDCYNKLLAGRMAVEAETLRAHLDAQMQVKTRPQQGD